jgi:undecaprenyl diphosphate synthase
MNNLNHVAFIMDGNGRWGLKKKRSRNFGHLQGVKTVQKIVKVSLEQKVSIISFYVFSSENWKRPKEEINFLFNLINVYFKAELKNIIKNNIKVNIIGRSKNLPTKIKKILNEVIKKTKKNKTLIINLAINYGSKNEIIDSVKKIILKKKVISEESLSKNLYIDLPNPDILIRTGGKKRLSNFMLWQLAYTELFFIDKLWPDFNKNDFIKILKKYYSIKRNFGGI